MRSKQSVRTADVLQDRALARDLFCRHHFATGVVRPPMKLTMGAAALRAGLPYLVPPADAEFFSAEKTNISTEPLAG